MKRPDLNHSPVKDFTNHSHSDVNSGATGFKDADSIGFKDADFKDADSIGFKDEGFKDADFKDAGAIGFEDGFLIAHDFCEISSFQILLTFRDKIFHQKDIHIFENI